MNAHVLYPVKLVLLLVTAGLLAGCGGRAMSVTHIDRHGKYRNQQLNFCLKVPEDWEIREELAGQVVVCLAPGPPFRANLVVQSQKGAPSAQAMADEAAKRLSSEIPDYKELAKGQSPEGYPWLSYSHHLGGRPLTALVFFAERQGRGLILTCTSTPQDFPRWEPKFREIPGTLHLDLAECPPEETPTPGSSGSPTPATSQTPSAETPKAPATPQTPSAEAPQTPATPQTPSAETPKAPATPSAAANSETPQAPHAATPGSPRPATATP